MVPENRGLNPGPLGHESSALTTRLRLLVNGLNVSIFDNFRLVHLS